VHYDDGGDAVANRDSLQDPRDAQVLEIETQNIVVNQPKRKQQRGATENAPINPRRRFPFLPVRTQRER
jgi:hypothetical protein